MYFNTDQRPTATKVLQSQLENGKEKHLQRSSGHDAALQAALCATLGLANMRFRARNICTVCCSTDV